MNRWVAGLLCVGLGVLAFLTYRWLFPSDEARIRRRVAEVVAAVNVRPEMGRLERLGAVNRLINQVTQDVTVRLGDPGAGTREIQGAADLREAVSTALLHLEALAVQLADLEVKVAPGAETATAQLVASVRVNGSADVQVHELRLTLSKMAGRWKLARVDPAPTLGL
ncbi:MAG: hypothetical protein FJ387_01245 [Verrucomicrobia bacterium]|nr:hypothetical protein [Verrucomicrobiota bacterium]